MGACRIIPLGGLGEVGKNMTVYEADGAIVVVDAGLAFPRDEHLGVDLVLPDFGYLRDRRVLPPPSGHIDTDVVILGSGIAGLTAAWALVAKPPVTMPASAAPARSAFVVLMRFMCLWFCFVFGFSERLLPVHGCVHSKSRRGMGNLTK